MSKCDLSIRLEEKDLIYRPGDTVRGEVVVEVNEPCSCKELALWCGWRTHGKGNRAEGVKERLVLFQGEMRPGTSQRYPFEFKAGTGPATYHGKLLNVDWYVQARADIPWAIDPKAEADFVLAAGEEGEYDFGPGYRPPAELYLAADKGLGCKIFIFSLLAAVGAILLVALGSEGCFPIGFGVLLMVVGVAGLLGTLWRGIAQKKLGVPEVRIGASTARPGDMVPVSIKLRPRGVVRLEAVTAELRGTEVVVSGSGTNKTTHKNVFHQAKETLDPGGRELPAGEELVIGGVVQVPEKAPPTFAASDNDLGWVIEVHIGIAGWPDWKREYPIAVRPGVVE
jgi:hypothetical protein